MSSKVRVRCSNCDAKISVASHLIGEMATCPACGIVTVLEDSGQSLRPTIAGIDGQSNTPGPDEQVRVPSTGQLVQQPASSLDNPKDTRKFGKYQLLRRIGRGGFGEVWEALDARLFRKVAIKLPIFAHNDERKIARFLTEGKAASRLRHPNIVSVIDAGAINNQHFLALGFIDGKPLNTFASENRLAERQCADLVRKLSSALDYAHGRGIVHRDIKPQNIVIQPSGEPQIVDFGLARILESDARQTVEGTLLGTPAFMAPEQARGAMSEIGPHTDQYSLGALMYWLLAGRVPYEGPYAVVLAQVIKSQPTRLRSLCAELDPRLESICRKAMSKEIEDRYRSCAELSDDLERYLNDESVSTYRIPFARRLVQWFRRNPVEGWSLLSIALMLVVGLSVSTAGWLRASYLTSASAQNLAVADAKLKEAKQSVGVRAKQLAMAREITQRVQSDRESLQTKNKAIEDETAKVEQLRRDNSALTAEIEAQIAAIQSKQQELEAFSQGNRQLTESIQNTEVSGVSVIDSALNAVLAEDWTHASVLLRSIPVVARDGVWRVLAESVRQRHVIPNMKRVLREECRSWGERSWGERSWGIDTTGRFLRLQQRTNVPYMVGPGRSGQRRIADVHRWFNLESGAYIASFDLHVQGISSFAFSPLENRLYGYAGNGALVYLDGDGTKRRFETGFQTTDVVLCSNGIAYAVARKLHAPPRVGTTPSSSELVELVADYSDIFLLSLEQSGARIAWSLNNDTSYLNTISLLDKQFPGANIQLALNNGNAIECKETLPSAINSGLIRMTVEFPHSSSSVPTPYVELAIGEKSNPKILCILSTQKATDWAHQNANWVHKGKQKSNWGEMDRESTNDYLQRLFAATPHHDRASLSREEMMGFGGRLPERPVKAIYLTPNEKYVVVVAELAVEILLCPSNLDNPDRNPL